MKCRSGKTNWRLSIGLALFALAGLVFLAGIGLILAGQPGWGVMFLAGPPEILCLVAAGTLGKENYPPLSRAARRGLRQPESSASASRLRYYTGLAGCLFNGIPLFLYAYVPEILPGGTTKLSVLLIADAVFFGSLFLAGGEFWEKLRRLFIWEGERFAGKGRI